MRDSHGGHDRHGGRDTHARFDSHGRHDPLGARTTTAESPDAAVPMRPGPVRRAVYLLSPIVHGLFGVLAVAGAAAMSEADLGPMAATVARLLYLSSALLSFFLTALIVTMRLRVRRGGALPALTIPLVYSTSPFTGALMLAGAYVSQLNGGAFAGGWAAMLLTTLSLVLLSRRSRS
ncbi:hypothetical protein [Frigoribacterium sp. Leaf263]|uniref:hypothetical protein n=1 Tax=Frigoribacterium sp. Leaf263 TaxID=1736313 RepID=UPI000A575AC5|nr:hypothetical protein [Frigoribacterium sp. Leaf263]